MRTVVFAAALASALSMAPTESAAAQDPEPAPAPRQVAVPRSERAAARDGQVGSANAREKGEARAADRGAARDPESSVEGRNRREPRAALEARPAEAPAPAASPAPVAENDEQRSGQRRGDVRRPPSGGSTQGGDGRGGDRSHGGAVAVDRAVPRTSVPPPSNRVFVFPDYYRNHYHRYYDPWGYGAFGLGYFYYSPWGWNPGYYGYYGYYGYGPPSGYAGASFGGYDVGAVKLKVKPRDAEVYVDGYFAGYVDDFDGMFQALKLDSGAYSIEIRKSGFETLRFDVRVQPERSITFRGDMKPVP
jgi:hypothetical protein